MFHASELFLSPFQEDGKCARIVHIADQSSEFVTITNGHP